MSSIRPVVRVIGPSIAYVELTKDHYAVVDAEDAERVEKHSWYASARKGRSSYAYATIKQRDVGLHRFIAGMDSPHIDHVSRNTLDNRKANLRPASNSQNQGNVGLKSDNTSGYTGVNWSKARRVWVAQIRDGGKLRYLGSFAEPESAAAAYRAAAKEKWGEFFADSHRKGAKNA